MEAVTTSNRVRRIGVHPPNRLEVHRRLFAALAEIEPISFVGAPEGTPDPLDAVIVFGRLPTALGGWACPVFSCETQVAVAGGLAGPVVFTDSPQLTPILRGRTLGPIIAADCVAAFPRDTEVLASVNGTPVWGRMQNGRHTVDIVRAPLPVLDETSPYLFQWLRKECFLELLPLLVFLKRVSRGPASPPHQLRASFMFDDPNLHRPRFGFIDYATLAASADKHNYHACFATVPLDGWYANKDAAGLFRAHADRLSFLVHGNNHTREELAQPYPDSQRLAYAAQALTRIARLEKMSGVPVAKVMAAPHGACSERMADALHRVGFDAACISRGSLMYYNKERSWPASVGMHPAEFVASGFPVIPRLRLAADAQHPIIFAALLEQPIILVGHHNDLPGGYGLLEDLARFINSLGDVKWSGLHEIAGGNAIAREWNGVLEVSCYSRRIEFAVPEGIRALRIGGAAVPGLSSSNGLPAQGARDATAASSGAEAPRCVNVVVTLDNTVRTFPFPAATMEEVAVTPGTRVSICLNHPLAVEPTSIEGPPVPAWAVVRRILAEGRDRVAPLRHRILGR